MYVAAASSKMSFLFRFRVIFVFLIILPVTGCLFRSHNVERVMQLPLKTATQQQLINYVQEQANRIQTMQATVDIDTAVGGAHKGKVTEYQQIRGYVLARKPSMLRMIGLFPIVRNRAFDMVSDGKDFKLWIPTKNRFIVGRNEVTSPNLQKPLENLRPKVIYDALLLPNINEENEIAVMENQSDTYTDAKGRKVAEAEYVMDVIRKGEQGWFLSRKIIFNRTDLLPHRQLIYDEAGELATNASYQIYKEYDGVSFPSRIEISRPIEEYDITLSMVKLELNKPLEDDKFTLEQPPGAVVVHLDHPAQDSKGGGVQVRK
ncbi:MAG: hypothetical protein QOD84_2120 [Acidobacteriaceae bacterium]|jgi:outer membrane lipoprotein-sorting protein